MKSYVFSPARPAMTALWVLQTGANRLTQKDPGALDHQARPFRYLAQTFPRAGRICSQRPSGTNSQTVARPTIHTTNGRKWPWRELVLFESGRHVIHSFTALLRKCVVTMSTLQTSRSGCIYVMYLRRFLPTATSLGGSSRANPPRQGQHKIASTS